MGCLLNYPYDKKEDYSDGISSPMGKLLNAIMPQVYMGEIEVSSPMGKLLNHSIYKEYEYGLYRFPSPMGNLLNCKR